MATARQAADDGGGVEPADALIERAPTVYPVFDGAVGRVEAASCAADRSAVEAVPVAQSARPASV